MDYYKTKISANSDISSLISGENNGVDREYLITEKKTKNNYIIYFAGKIKECIPSSSLSINAKFQYGYRDARIEIAFFVSGKLFLVKTLRNIKKIDQESLKLDSIITAITNEYQEIEVIGCVLVPEKGNYVEVFQEVSKLLQNKFILLSEDEILTNKTKFFTDYGLLN
jgi:hypothetical protein